MAYITGRLDVRNGTLGTSCIRSVTANGTLGSGIINGTEIGYLSGITSNIQTQFTAKAAATGYTASRLLQANANGTLVVSPISVTANGTINGSSSAPGMTSTTTLTFYERGNGQVHKRILTAGEAVVKGNICRLKAGKYWKTDSDNATQVSGQLAMANATIAQNATGEFYFPPCTIVSTGFPNGSLCYLGPTAGGMVGTAPGTGKQVRLVGDTNGTTIFNFYPSPNWLEMA